MELYGLARERSEREMSEINKWLDRMDDTRETRYGEVDTREIKQYKGFRTEWSRYIEDNLDNLYNS